MTFTVELDAVSKILKNHGLDENGAVQRQWTTTVNRRIGRYMPYRTGMLSGKLKYMASPTEILVAAPYARYQYYGRVMVNSATGKGPRMIPGVGWRWTRGAVLKATSRPLRYDTSKHPEAGPLWDQALLKAEETEMLNEIRVFIRSREGK